MWRGVKGGMVGGEVGDDEDGGGRCIDLKCRIG